MHPCESGCEARTRLLGQLPVQPWDSSRTQHYTIRSMQQATNPGDPISSSSPAHVSQRWLPDCFRHGLDEAVRSGSYKGRHRSSAEAGLQSSYQLVAHSGGVSERADERSPAGVRLGHRPQKPVVEMSVSPGMPRLSRCRRRLGPKQPQVPRMVSLSPLGFACITLRLAVAAKRHGRLRSRQGKRQGVSSTGSVQ